jgi:hypothetical protein
MDRPQTSFQDWKTTTWEKEMDIKRSNTFAQLEGLNASRRRRWIV